ncbi:MAG: hypothetical protein LBT13_07415, partial [Treponema sp.]|nr:hypothetical protein [Treponema sp.]
LVNGTIALVVEAKTTMTQGDVDKHETRMEILRHEPNSLFANRKLYGAMAGVKSSSAEICLRQRLFRDRTHRRHDKN